MEHIRKGVVVEGLGRGVDVRFRDPMRTTDEDTPGTKDPSVKETN